MVCLGRGKCGCDKTCQCNDGFSGDYCQTEKKDMCKILEPCVKAKLFKDSSDFRKSCEDNTIFNKRKVYGRKIYNACKLPDEKSAEQGM